jgi:hypothetical protein
MNLAKTNASDLSAKLLATENVSVRRANTQTASFDIKSRVLTLPLWKDMTPEVEGMLIGHEVGHALYTSHEYLEPIYENRKLMGYLNVLEDVRIEKLMKRKYPGIRKTMAEGYRQLNEKDFFGVQKIDMNSMLLIDKINLYFKAGYSCGVKFTIGEKNFVDRAERTESVDDVIALAQEVYAYSKEQLEKRLKEQQLIDPEPAEEIDPDELDDIDDDMGGSVDDSDMDETDEESEDETNLQGEDDKQSSLGQRDTRTEEEKTQEQVEQELESKTDKVFSKKLEELADTSTEFKYYNLDTEYVCDYIVPFKQVIAETADMEEWLKERPSSKAELQKWKDDNSRVVNYLVKEFEMRKSATLYKRAQTSKVGSLDMKKVWGYKLNDDLFKRVTTIPAGKNHGMIFLLDWSGSMDPMLQDTVHQVITLAMFCQRAQIPYQVLAFSSQYSWEDDGTRWTKIRDKANAMQEGTLSNASVEFALFELLSSKMRAVEFNTMVRRLNTVHYFRSCKNGAYQTGGTPLNEALSYMMKHIPKFISSNNIEKMTLITLTDGEGSSLSSRGRYSLDDWRTDIVGGTYKKVRQKHFLQDPVTKKTYAISRYSNTQTEAILRMIKDRFDIKSVGFFICHNSRRYLQSAVGANLPEFSGSISTMVDEMRKSFRDDGFYSMRGTGRDDLFIIPQTTLKLEDTEIQVNDGQSAKIIARNFTKVMAGKKTSRVLLNQFIGYVA